MKGNRILFVTDDPAHNHVQAVLRAIQGVVIPRGEMSHADIYHDDWCAFLRGGRCNCNPDVVIRRKASDG